MVKRGRENGSGAVVARLVRLEAVQRDGNARLGRIEETLATSSRLFELMHERLEGLEHGQRQLVDGQKQMVDGQRLVIDRLDRLVRATIAERTRGADRFSRVERRLEALERKMSAPK